MNERKKIESLFQEKFKEFEVAPPEMAWTNIKAELEKKKQKRRIFPFWWKLSGIAALVTIGFFVGTNFNSSKKPLNENPVVIEDNNQQRNNTTNGNSSSEDAILEKENQSNETISNQEVVVNSNNKDKSENRLVSISKEKAIQFAKNNSSQNNDVATNFNKNSSNNDSNSKNNSELINQQNQNRFSDKEIKTSNLVSQIILKKEEKTNSNFNTSENQTVEIKVDSPQLETISENKLEEILKEKEKNKTDKKESKTNKWQITTNVSPIYASSNATGSAIDEKYIDNKKTYENTISYGLGVNYAINKKVKIRTGINKFSLGYNTNDVGFYAPQTATQTLNNVPTSSEISGLPIAFVDNNTNTITFTNEVSLTGLPEIVTIEKGTINQKLGYYEVPLELSYAIIDKRFGINIIGGISILFLNENKISTITSTTKIDTGKADNLNNIHFSTNVGLGFKYNLIKSIQINIDPMLKYQINTFKNDVGGFKPYFFGIYSGINYQF